MLNCLHVNCSQLKSINNYFLYEKKTITVSRLRPKFSQSLYVHMGCLYCVYFFILLIIKRKNEIISSFVYRVVGEVELENLPLRKDALRNLGLPLQALKGTVGRIKLQIPVRKFRTAPWCIIIENVYVVIGPINLDEVTKWLLNPFKHFPKT